MLRMAARKSCANLRPGLDRYDPRRELFYRRCAGVALIFHLFRERSVVFTSSSEPKNPAKEFCSVRGRLRVCRKSRWRNWSVEEMTAEPIGRYSWVPCAHEY